MPDRYESGSHNAIGIAGLSAAVAWILEKGTASLHEHEMDLVRTFIDGLSNVECLHYFGPQGVRNRIGVFSVRTDGIEPQELSAILESSFGILTRSGLHCAPLMHQAIGTLNQGGTTRFSFGPFLSKQDVKFAADALAEVATLACPEVSAWERSRVISAVNFQRDRVGNKIRADQMKLAVAELQSQPRWARSPRFASICVSEAPVRQLAPSSTSKAIERQNRAVQIVTKAHTLSGAAIQCDDCKAAATSRRKQRPRSERRQLRDQDFRDRLRGARTPLWLKSIRRWTFKLAPT